MSQIIIDANNISKRYRIGVKKGPKTLTGQVKDFLSYPINNFRRIAQLTSFSGEDDKSVFWALRDINFKVERGEVLGIIGHNGAGKSTLLKILSRITEPTTGQITFRGRVSALLEVGTGFHPELTARDNIYMNGTILGMRRHEITSKFDEIVSFSGIERHLDTPVKFYSSGMKVRLAFSVAAHLEPEILIIDEVLAVGDAEFQKKCLGKMNDVAHEGRTVLFVSHDMSAVKGLCNRCFLMNRGSIIKKGSTSDIIDYYFEHRQSQNGILEEGDLSIKDIRFSNGEGKLYFTIVANKQCPQVAVGLIIKDDFNRIIFKTATNLFQRREVLSIPSGSTTFILSLDELPFISGDYSFDIEITTFKGKELAFFGNVYRPFINSSVNYPGNKKLVAGSDGIIKINHKWEYYFDQ